MSARSSHSSPRDQPDPLRFFMSTRQTRPSSLTCPDVPFSASPTMASPRPNPVPVFPRPLIPCRTRSPGFSCPMLRSSLSAAREDSLCRPVVHPAVRSSSRRSVLRAIYLGLSFLAHCDLRTFAIQAFSPRSPRPLRFIFFAPQFRPGRVSFSTIRVQS